MPFISEDTRFVTRVRRFILFFGVTIFSGMFFPGFADLRSEEELQSLKTKIDNLQEQLQSSRNQEQTLVSGLEKLERELAKLVTDRHKQTLNLATLKSRKTELDKKLYNLELADNDAQLKLRRVLRSSYIFHRQDSIRLMLNQTHPENIARTLSMYRYVVASKKKQIMAIRRHQSEVRDVARMLENQQTAIDQTLARLDKNKTALSQAGQARKLQLNRVQAKLSKDRRQVAYYQQRQTELKLLLTNLQRKKTQNNRLEQNSQATQTNSSAIQSISPQSGQPSRQPVRQRLNGQPNSPLVAGGFRKNKGRLAMPLVATIENRFGQIKPEGGLRWEGLMFDVAEGQKVSAIYPGQVVFSDWFRGYGQLLVLDHGGGYMSLYGHNQVLHVGLGSAVDVGQIVAFAGSTGGLTKPGLYFEIRYNGVPDDPSVWCYDSF